MSISVQIMGTDNGDLSVVILITTVAISTIFAANESAVGAYR
ncbi:hypothetical protein [Nostoc sp.]